MRVCVFLRHTRAHHTFHSDRCALLTCTHAHLTSQLTAHKHTHTHRDITHIPHSAHTSLTCASACVLCVLAIDRHVTSRSLSARPRHDRGSQNRVWFIKRGSTRSLGLVLSDIPRAPDIKKYILYSASGREDTSLHFIVFL